MSSVRNRQWFIGTLIAIAAIWLPAVNGSWPARAPADDGVRTIVVIAKDMRFNANNPTLNVAPGESVRIVLRNDDPGMKHDLVIPGLGIRTPVLESGEQAVLEFVAPEAGSYEYFCSMHPVTMRGYLQVELPR